MPGDPQRTMRTSRILPFAPAAIYGAFASPDLLASWWGPQGFANTFEAFEFREGGRWQFVMHGPDGKRYANECIFTRLVPAQQVVIRHSCAPLFTLTVDLAAVSGGTRLDWAQVFDDAETAQAVRAIVEPANEQNLDRLIRALAGAPQRGP